MRDYTYQDMLRMQEEAAYRVREMKKRAALAMDDEPEPTPKKIQLPDEVKHISYPVEIEDSVNDESVNDEIAEKKDLSSGILDFLTRDKDALLILSLIAVLSTESNDYFTTYALLYLLL
ncbi:MAG: hypothetical protein IKM66_03415 [Clostridia bacterium]|nr:hypothetical protein [Clostridia bacterium]